MEVVMTKDELIEVLRSRCAEWDVLLAQVPEERMTQPGAAGTWSKM
jgi:hypothetical protein